MSSRLQRTLLVLLAVIILSASLPVSQARAASGYVGWIDVKITCNQADYTTRVTFYGAYDGQLIYYRFLKYNSATGVFEPTTWQYVQASSSQLNNNTGGDYHHPAYSGQIISIVTEAYYYNPTTGGWEYAGMKIADHRQSVYSLGGMAYCFVY